MKSVLFINIKIYKESYKLKLQISTKNDGQRNVIHMEHRQAVESNHTTQTLVLSY